MNQITGYLTLIYWMLVVTIANCLVELESRSKAMSKLVGLLTETKSQENHQTAIATLRSKRVDVAVWAHRFNMFNRVDNF